MHAAVSMLSRPDAKASHDLESRRAGEEIGVDLRAIAYDQRDRVAKLRAKLAATVDEVSS